MSGAIKRYCFDTNILIGLFSGDIDYRLIEAEEIILSVISEIEYLAYDKLSAVDRQTYTKFKNNIRLVYLDDNSETLRNKIIEIRKKYKLKLPDAIIAASAMINNATLVTNDKAFNKIDKLKILTIK